MGHSAAKHPWFEQYFEEEEKVFAMRSLQRPERHVSKMLVLAGYVKANLPRTYVFDSIAHSLVVGRSILVLGMHGCYRTSNLAL